MTRFLVSFAAVTAFSAVAHAQVAENGPNLNTVSASSFDPDNAVAPVSIVEGRGVKIGEGSVLRPVLGVETGFVTNVFYQENSPVNAGVLRLLAQIGAGSLGNSRLSPTADDPEDKGSFQYRADLRASYDFLFSTNDNAEKTGGLGIGASFHALANPNGPFTFGIDEDFARLIRATNYETDANVNRDINTLGLKLLYHSQDHAFGGYLYYDNTIDVFERSTQTFADRMFNRIGIHPTWQWLPQTQVYLDVSQGVVTGIGTSTNGIPGKVTSYPLTALAGISTLFTLKTTFNIYGGYTNGFYTSGPNFSAPTLGAQLGYRYSPLGRATLQYMLQYQDSVNANYFRDHIIQLSIQQAYEPVVFLLQPEVHFREYVGITQVVGPATRDDLIFAAIAGVHYNFRNWFAGTLDYRVSVVSTDYRYMPIGGGMIDDPSFVHHELLLGVRAAL